MLKSLTLVSILGLCSTSLTSCGSTSLAVDKALVEFTTNGHGTVSVKGLAEDGSIGLNTALTVQVQPEENYYLDSLLVNGDDITSALTFTPTEAINYIVNATFLKDIKEGEYQVNLTSDSGVEVGKTLQLNTTVYGPNKKVSYFLSDPDLAKVDANGLVTAKKPGFVTVTATAEGSDKSNPVTDSCSFFIMPSYIARMVDSMNTYDLTKGSKLTRGYFLLLRPR